MVFKGTTGRGMFSAVNRDEFEKDFKSGMLIDVMAEKYGERIV